MIRDIELMVGVMALFGAIVLTALAYVIIRIIVS